MTNRVRNDESEEDAAELNELLAKLRPFNYYEQQVLRRIHHFYISDVVEEPKGYVDMIHQIRVAPEGDIVLIHINTPGGNLDTGIQIVNAMTASAAHVVCSIEGIAYSLGTLLFLAADEFLIHDNCMMMFHNYSGGIWGKGHEQISQLEATTKWFNVLARKYYIPFLSEEELDRMTKGEDLWMESDEVRQRLDHMVTVMEDEMEAAAEAEIKAEKAAMAAAKRASKKK